MIMTEFGLEKRRRPHERNFFNSIEREQQIFEQILRTILDEDLTRYDVADWIWLIWSFLVFWNGPKMWKLTFIFEIKFVTILIVSVKIEIASRILNLIWIWHFY